MTDVPDADLEVGEDHLGVWMGGYVCLVDGSDERRKGAFVDECVELRSAL